MSLTKKQSIELLNKVEYLPTVPDLLHTIFSESNNPNLSVKSLVNLIKKDQSIVLMVVRIANSAYFNRSNVEITSLEKAIVRVGIAESVNIAMSITLLHAIISDINIKEVTKFWVQCYITAKTAMYIAKKLDPNESIIVLEDIYVVALFQSIGRVALASAVDLFYFNDEMCKLSGKDILELEEKRYGINYIEAGSHILDLWNIPKSISNKISSINLIEDPNEDVTVQNICKLAISYVNDTFDHINTFDHAIVEIIPILKEEFKS